MDTIELPFRISHICPATLQASLVPCDQYDNMGNGI